MKIWRRGQRKARGQISTTQAAQGDGLGGELEKLGGVVLAAQRPKGPELLVPQVEGSEKERMKRDRGDPPQQQRPLVSFRAHQPGHGSCS